ncbi:hypothetical protein IJJ54_00810 [Candidatus Saccharibacteria bacterium]|nr:hypothetical protein [Candidatus Saccharibacteria bacterium]
MLKIEKRWRDRLDWWCVGRIWMLLVAFWLCFGWALGFYRANGEEGGGLRDGDLVIYDKIVRQYGYEDAVLYEKDGVRVSEYAAMNGGELRGRILVLLRVRGVGDE